MPKAPENRIGQIFGRWRVIKELARGIGMDHGKPRLKTRNFEVECTQCGEKRTASYKNIYYDKLNHGCKSEWEKSHDALLNGAYGKVLLGKEITNDRGFKFKVLKIRIPKPGEYKYKTLIYSVQCVICGKTKQISYHGVNSGEFAICKCWKNAEVVQTKTRDEIMKEIDDEFEFMLYLNAQDELMNYLMGKFPDEVNKILQEDE